MLINTSFSRGSAYSSGKKAVLKKHTRNRHFQQVLSDVGLTDDEALRLASRYNSNGHFVHRMTHHDYVRQYIIIYIIV